MEFETIKNVIVEQMEVDAASITMETRFMDDLNADSLDVFQIVDSLETVYGVEFDNAAAEQIRTVGDAVTYIKKALGK